MPEVTPFQVLIVDDHPLMRRGIRQLLELDPAFYVVAEAGDGASAIPAGSEYERSERVRYPERATPGWCDGAIIIILYALIDAGADGYLLKDSDPEVLLEAIRKGANGGKVFSDRVNEYLRERERFGAQEDP